MQNNLAHAKVIFLGDAGGGKTSFIHRFVADSWYVESNAPASFMSKFLRFNDKEIKFILWDTAGQERYHSLAKMYYRDANAAIMVYDITNRSSFEALKRWHKELQKFGPKDIVVTIVGNKEDLVENEEIPEEEAKEYAESIGALYRKTSAKTSYGVVQVFRDIALKMITDREYQAPQAKRETEMIQLGKPVRDNKKWCGCW